MSKPKSFLAILESPAMQEAIQTFPPSRIIVFVEGESDWAWLRPKVNPKVAELRYEDGANGGFRFVLSSVNECVRKGLRCIGIVDRDFGGLADDRHQDLHLHVFDTEFRDSEVMMFDSGALLLAMERSIPPNRRPRGISENTMEALRQAVLVEASLLGALQLVNRRRFLAKNRARPIIPAEALTQWKETFHCDVHGHWKLEVRELVSILQADYRWDSHAVTPLCEDVSQAMEDVERAARELVARDVDQEELEYLSSLLLGNGHVVMDYIAESWVAVLTKAGCKVHPLHVSKSQLIDRMKSLFEFALFKRTQLYAKVEAFCQQTYKTSIFISA